MSLVGGPIQFPASRARFANDLNAFPLMVLKAVLDGQQRRLRAQRNGPSLGG
jgi:hypothetical protein